jgi:uncharacterized protein
VVTDMRVTGPAAQFGRGVMQDVSAKMMRQFADCLAQEMTGPEPAAAGTWSQAATGDVPSGGPAAGGEPAPAVTGEEAAAPAGDVPAAAAETGPAAEPSAAPRPRPTPEVLDLADASREAVLKRAAPVIGAAVLLLILLRIVRR